MARFKKQAVSEDAPAASPGLGRWVRRLVFPALIVVAAVGAFLFARHQATSGSVPAIEGLPSALNSSALVVGQGGDDLLVLGTHVGLYESVDGGAEWKIGSLDGQDVLVLAHSPDGSLWAGGPEVVAHSSDGGLSWVEHEAAGLPAGGVTGLAVGSDGRLVAVTEEGLFVSADAGESFEVLEATGADGITSVAAAGDVFYAVDPVRGVVRSTDGAKTWEVVHSEAVGAIAASAADPRRVIASGERVWLSTDGGETWAVALEPDGDAGAVAWSPGSAEVAYVLVPTSRRLHRTDDGGESWSRVG